MPIDNILKAKNPDEAEKACREYVEKDLGYTEDKMAEWDQRINKGDATPMDFLVELKGKVEEDHVMSKYGKVLGSCIMWGQKHAQAVTWSVVVFIIALFILALYNIYDIYKRRKAEKKKLQTETITVYKASQLTESSGTDVVSKAMSVLPTLTATSQDPAEVADKFFEGIREAGRNAAAFFAAALMYLKSSKAE